MLMNTYTNRPQSPGLSSDMSSAYGVWESKIWSLALARMMESVCGSKDYVELEYDGAQGWRLALVLSR